mgnify:CR=1 FL=1
MSMYRVRGWEHPENRGIYPPDVDFTTGRAPVGAAEVKNDPELERAIAEANRVYKDMESPEAMVVVIHPTFGAQYVIQPDPRG